LDIRISLADDHPIFRAGLRSVIAAAGDLHVIAEADDGDAALQQIEALRPDVAVLDMDMPKRDGFGVVAELARRRIDVPAVFLTMHREDRLVNRAFDAGVRGFVLKSDTEKHLIAALDALSIHRSYFSGAISDTLLDQFLDSKPHAAASSLTHREREVVQQVAEGRINKEIAQRLSISVKTVETHRASAMRKLKLRTTADLVRYAVRNQLIQA
jgi:DNA-binding NarL/FixJ family response regulator